jgi:hypothetical protein
LGFLPFDEVALFGQAALVAQLGEELVDGRIGVEPGGRKVPSVFQGSGL